MVLQAKFIMEKIPTIKEIAKRLKVSKSTVSRALHGHPSIGLVTTMRVKKVANELNYEPDRTAIFFKQRKTFTIGIIMPNVSEAFFSSALCGIEDFAGKKNYNVIIGQSLEDPEKEKHFLETMKNHRVDGVIMSITKNTIDYGVFDQLKRYNIPVVFFDRVPKMNDIHYSACNLQSGLLQSIDYLIAKGHCNIGLINGPTQLSASKERLEAYRKGLENHSITFTMEYVVSSDLSCEQNYSAMQNLLSLKERPSAIITFNDYVALDAIKVARKNNLIINRDISFVSFANLPIWQYMDNLPLASIEQFPQIQGKNAAEILFKLIDGNNNPEQGGPVVHNIKFDSRMVSYSCVITG